MIIVAGEGKSGSTMLLMFLCHILGVDYKSHEFLKTGRTDFPEIIKHNGIGHSLEERIKEHGWDVKAVLYISLGPVAAANKRMAIEQSGGKLRSTTGRDTIWRFLDIRHSEWLANPPYQQANMLIKMFKDGEKLTREACERAGVKFVYIDYYTFCYEYQYAYDCLKDYLKGMSVDDFYNNYYSKWINQGRKLPNDTPTPGHDPDEISWKFKTRFYPYVLKREFKFDETGAPIDPLYQIARYNQQGVIAEPHKMKEIRGWGDEPAPWKKYTHIKTSMHVSAECHYFYRTARHMGSGNYLNLGVFRGLSTACMAMGLRDSGSKGKVYAVDLFNHVHNQRKAFDEGMADAGLGKFVEVCPGFTYDWHERLKGVKFNFILIDADHHYESCYTDFKNYSPFLAPNGLIAFHDVDMIPVGRVIEEHLTPDKWEQVAHIYKLKVFKRK